VKSIGYEVEAFASAREFLQRSIYEGPSCLLLDVRMSGISGPELQAKISKREVPTPIIFLTAHMDMHTGVEAMKDGAVDFLLKPVEEHALFETIDKALDKNAQLIKEQNEIKRIKQLFAAITPRELVVFRWVITGMLNKNIALEAKITERTVKAHRSQIMKKLNIASVAELVRFALKAGISPAK
jgi:FixJ family two-component response regulator